jgi:hypothetical protein
MVGQRGAYVGQPSSPLPLVTLAAALLGEPLPSPSLRLCGASAIGFSLRNLWLNGGPLLKDLAPPLPGDKAVHHASGQAG